MANRIDLFDSTYGHFTDRVLAAVRQETFGEDLGQNSWLTAAEYDRFISRLRLTTASSVLEVASGSGGPAHHLASTVHCHVTGIDVNECGITTANERAERSGLGERLRFRLCDADAALPFADDSFDALFCIDAMNHFPHRLDVLREWRRVLRPGGRALFTDPVVITGPVTNEELALRSSIGLFVFVPPGVTEELIARSGLQLVDAEDVTANAALVSGRWHEARERHREALIVMEGRERFEGLQAFFATVHRLTSERRLSRVAYLVAKPAT